MADGVAEPIEVELRAVGDVHDAGAGVLGHRVRKDIVRPELEGADAAAGAADLEIARPVGWVGEDGQGAALDDDGAGVRGDRVGSV